MATKDKAELQRRQAEGEMKARIYEEHIKPFVEAKEAILFEAFKQVPATDVVQLQTVRMQLTAISALAAEFQSFINDGKLAKFELENEK